ncbi:hypothetical protein Vpro01_00926 [Vibrio proteolyticus]
MLAQIAKQYLVHEMEFFSTKGRSRSQKKAELSCSWNNFEI